MQYGPRLPFFYSRTFLLPKVCSRFVISVTKKELRSQRGAILLIKEFYSPEQYMHVQEACANAQAHLPHLAHFMIQQLTAWMDRLRRPR